MIFRAYSYLQGFIVGAVLWMIFLPIVIFYKFTDQRFARDETNPMILEYFAVLNPFGDTQDWIPAILPRCYWVFEKKHPQVLFLQELPWGCYHHDGVVMTRMMDDVVYLKMRYGGEIHKLRWWQFFI